MIKRAFDFIVALIALVVLGPLLLAVALIVKVGSPGPALFRQERMGRNFRPFRINKFRTMVADAPKLGAAITAGRDPRITRVGHVLRATKVDELPQLINVLVGEMSFVGPRPEVPHYVELFREDYETVLSVRPGITDLASLKYRDENAILGDAADPEAVYVEKILPDKIALAKEYIARQSLGFDVWIIWQTLLAVVRR